MFDTAVADPVAADVQVAQPAEVGRVHQEPGEPVVDVLGVDGQGGQVGQLRAGQHPVQAAADVEEADVADRGQAEQVGGPAEECPAVDVDRLDEPAAELGPPGDAA